MKFLGLKKNWKQWLSLLCLCIEKLCIIIHADLLRAHDDLQGIRLRILIGSKGNLLRTRIHI